MPAVVPMMHAHGLFFWSLLVLEPVFVMAVNVVGEW